MAIIHVDNRKYEVDGEQSLLHACLSQGLDIPYFCWHPALGSVGACRQCAVKLFKDENDKRGKIVMACMTEAHDGARLSIKDAEAAEFRKGIIEWLMVNHPHDCPVCDEGGECHLQDMTVMTGHNYRRYRFTKRTHRNQYLGPFVNHEMNRCIQCYRCVRFYRDYAGGRDFDVFGCHDDIYFGREEEGILENEFSGNLIEVCPTGVFTDKTFKEHYTRKWDLQTAPGICTHCSLGCNTIPGEREGLIRRVRNRYHGEVNGYFLCDRGRYGYEFANGSSRLRSSIQRSEGEQKVLEDDDVARVLGPLVSRKERLIGIGSPRASLEANFLLRRLVRPERFSMGLPAARRELLMTCLKLLREGPARSPSLREISQADAVLVLGEDLTNTAPLLALSIRQSVLQAPTEIATKLHIPRWHDQAFRNAIGEVRGPLYLAVPHATHLDDIARKTLRLAPNDIARLGAQVADAVKSEAAHVDAVAKEIASSLIAAKHPLVISGVHSGSKAVLEAAARVAWALCERGCAASLSLVPSECNGLGLAMMGGNSLEEVSSQLEKGADTIFILENDISRFGEIGEKLLSSSPNTILLDCVNHRTSEKADFVLATGTIFETDGTFVNQEGRAQRSIRVLKAPRGIPPQNIKEDWQWLRELLVLQDDVEAQKIQTFSDVTSLVAESDPLFSPIKEIVLGQVTPVPGERIPRQPHRFSGRTALTANVSVHEPKPEVDPDSPLSFSMEGDASHPPSSLIPFFWWPGWNSVQAVMKFQSEVGGPLRGGDPGRRLIEPKKEARPSLGPTPEPFRRREGEYLLFSVYQIFGSEELSARSTHIGERTPSDFVAMSELDAKRLEVRAGDKVEVRTGNFVFQGLVNLALGLPEGCAGIFLGSRRDLAIRESPYGVIRRIEEETWAA